MQTHMKRDPANTRTYSARLREALESQKQLMREYTDEELQWRARFAYLKERGYMLRRRYNPTLPPSWDVAGNEHIDPREFEDFIASEARLKVIDATNEKNQMVYIKRVGKNSPELAIAQLLMKLERDHPNPKNHCVPILDIIQPQEREKCIQSYFEVMGTKKDAERRAKKDIEELLNEVYIVMPFLRNIDDPAFETVEDVVDLVDQLLEGLSFMHSLGIAHRDCAYKNLMMDASALFPEGFHPVSRYKDPTASRYITPLPRQPGSVKYFFVDFGISTLKGSEGAEETALVLGHDGLDQDVPELSTQNQYNPFKVDIFIIGNLFKKLLCENFSNVSFLLPLSQIMTHQNPSERPSAADAERQWSVIKHNLSSIQRTWRIKRRDEPWIQTAVLDTLKAGRLVLGWFTDVQG